HQVIIHSNEQKWSIEADEALTMCDAGMERARHALGMYKGKKLWAWKDVATYCALRPTDGDAIKKEAQTLFKSSRFQTYTSVIWPAGSTGTVSANSTDPAACLPSNPILPVPGDENQVLFAWSTPFQRGAIYISITAPAGGVAGA